MFAESRLIVMQELITIDMTKSPIVVSKIWEVFISGNYYFGLI
jgi:hypothetical protein